MRDQFEDKYTPQFAIDLVDQRISTESNDRQLYLRLLGTWEARHTYIEAEFKEMEPGSEPE